MYLSMKEKNDEKSWEGYMSEKPQLMAEVSRRIAILEEKYQNIDKSISVGLDDEDPKLEERREITHWFGQEVKRLRNKYGIVE